MSRRLVASFCCLSVLALLATSLAYSAEEKKAPKVEAKRDGRAPIRDQRRTFRAHVKSWTDIRRSRVVMQQRDYSCGAAALASVMQYHLNDKSATEMALLLDIVKMLTAEEMKERVENGLSMTDLRRLAVRRGYLSSSVRLKFDKLQESKVPLVVGIVVNEFDHFVVYRGTDGKYVYLADPARGNVRTPIDEFKKQWQKNAALVVIDSKETGDKVSPYMVAPHEVFLGTVNYLYLRDRTTTKFYPR